MQTVRELSNFDGRQSGTAGGQATAAYIARHLPEAALQPFPITTVQIESSLRVKLRAGQRFVTLEKGQDFLPILNPASTGPVSAPIVFVGYGIVEPKQGLDEYAGLSINGKIVLFSFFRHFFLLNEASCGTPKALVASEQCLGLLTNTTPLGIWLWRSTLVKIEGWREITVKIEKNPMFDSFSNEDIESELHTSIIQLSTRE